VPHPSRKWLSLIAVLCASRVNLSSELVRMRHASKDFRRPVLIQDPRRKDILIDFHKFTPCDNGSYVKEGPCIHLKLSDILGKVETSQSLDDSSLSIERDQLVYYKALIMSRTGLRSRPHSAYSSQQQPESGRIVVEQAPVLEASDSALRRSSRTRRVIVHEYT
jgi:hypothetical protein